MTNIEGNKKWFRDKTQTLLSLFAKWRRWVKISLVIGGALTASAASTISSMPGIQSQLALHVLQGIGVLLVFLGGVLLEFVDEGAADAIYRANELAEAVEQHDKEIASLDHDFQWFTHLYSIAGALRDVVESVIVSGPGSPEVQKRRFGDMLDVIVADKAILFGIDSDRWNFAVYLLNPETGNLDCAACRRPIRAEEEAQHRSWKPGEGHVGTAFQTQREIVAGDTSAPEARALFDGPDPLRHDSDRRRYRSIASLPVRLAGEPTAGILVATSDVPHRFRIRQRDEETAMDPLEPLRILASALAFTIKSADLCQRPIGSTNHEPNEN